MRTMLVVVILGLVVWLTVVKSSDNRQMAIDKRNIDELTEKLKEVTDEPSLKLQSECAGAAKAFFSREKYSADDNARYENHYNPELRKCFILVTTTNMKSPSSISTTKFLSDAVEGKEYGEYVAFHEAGKEGNESKPLGCYVLKKDGSTNQPCHSQLEFETLMLQYADFTN